MPVCCKDCVFWNGKAILGAIPKKAECRRYPPRFDVADSSIGLWPIVSRDDWCGESQDKNIREEMEKARQRKIAEW